MKITNFDKQYAFLSNFYPCVIVYNNVQYASVEAAFQASKSLDIEVRKKFAYNTDLGNRPGKCKRKGREILLRPDWENIKNSIMFDLVLTKFQTTDELLYLLLATGNAELIEGNTWGDTYWGVCNGHGENMLGKILMEVRSILKTTH